jgi:hypothetical protein
VSHSSRVELPLLATIASTISVLIAALLPWLRTGETSRNAYALARSAAIIGVFDGWPRRVCLAAWYVLPLLVAMTWTAGALRKRAVVATLGSIIGLMSIAAGATVLAQTNPEAGPITAIVTGAVAVCSAAWLARTARVPVSGT